MDEADTLVRAALPRPELQESAMGGLEKMDAIKYKIVYWFFTHIFLRRIGKRYPDLFQRWVFDATDNQYERKVMFLRYTGDEQEKFEAIAIKMNIDIRRVFRYHKNVVDKIIS